MRRTTSFNARELDEMQYGDDTIMPLEQFVVVTRTGPDGTVLHLDRGGWYHPTIDSACQFDSADEARRAIITAAAGRAA